MFQTPVIALIARVLSNQVAMLRVQVVLMTACVPN
jgi:hypothetical protein